jgi:pimeloyl-ACP methyl ester carboxylesterase
MNTHQDRVLAEIAELLRVISDNILPGEDITGETRLLEDLGLQSIGLASLSGRIQIRYGAAASLVPLFAERKAGPLANLRVGEIVDYLADVLDRPGVSAVATAEHASARQGAFSSAKPGQRPRNDNAGVLSEHAPTAHRTVLQLPDGQVEVFMAGNGPPLILMHPINIGAGVFARQFACLTDRHQVICAHSPGVGATTWNADMTLSGLARLYRTVLDELSVRPPFHVLGSSFGGLIAQSFALLCPEACASLSLVCSNYRVDDREVRPLAAIVAEDFDSVASGSGDRAMLGGRAELEELVLRCQSMDSRIGLSYMRALANQPSMLARLPEITVPALILQGRHDTLLPDKPAHVLYGTIPDALFAELPDAGHFPCLTHPAQVHQLLLPFLAAHTAGSLSSPDIALTQVTAVARGAPAAPAALQSPDSCAVIISTGRCGSTLLSTLIAEEPETLSVSESLLPIKSHLMSMPLTELTGAQYWSLLSKPNPVAAMMAKAGILPGEVRYPSSGRSAGQADLPPIMYATLPGVSADPDLLFTVLAEKVPQFPAQPVGAHHKMLLKLLAHLAGRRRWVERTGGSSDVADALLEQFPEARFVYLTRNIPDTALSMSRHSLYQLDVARYEFHRRYGTDPYTSLMGGADVPGASDLPEEMQRVMPDQITRQALQDLGGDIELHKARCVRMMDSAERAIASKKPKNLHRLRYEDLQAKPFEELAHLAEFLGFTDPSGWAARTAGKVRPPGAQCHLS